MKLQVTNYKSQTNSKSQIQNSKRVWNFGHWNLDIVWDLVLGACNFRSRGRANGFTLIELLAVIAIIGVLATYVLVQTRQVRERARVARAQAESDSLRKAITLLANDTGEWPGHTPAGVVGSGGSLNEVWDLTTPEAGLLATDGSYENWNGPYMRAILNDPWGNPYFF